MKIIISTDSVKFPVTGIARYTLELINNISGMPEVDSLKFLSGLKVVERMPEINNNPAVSSGKLKNMAKNNKFVSDVYRLVVPYMKGRALKHYSDYIFHSPNYYLPPGHQRACATFHDLSIFHYPEFHPKGRVHLMKKELSHTVRRARVLLTDSEYTKKEVADFFNYDPAKIVVAPLASSGDFFPRDQQACQAILAKYQLDYKHFTFFAGTIEPRKNIKNLLLAYQMLPREISTRYPLVISGYHGWQSAELHRLFETGAREGWIKYLGYVDQQTLSTLFSACRAFLFPSRYEGFGLPVLEAMAAGSPVITSNVSSLPEVAGGAALMVDPDDVELLTQHIQSVIGDDALCQNLTDRGFRQNAKFSWQRCAVETMKAYKLVDE